ncbi:unnamed protein product [Dovyalis caffra]|uniref:Uncharacterized protein n=1 Tax=Dovyalis caffra TaxID=77055 RepID=A0AAV1QVX0_9ROSI|nr:unnamed protein product [Dovyalis caffra]
MSKNLPFPPSETICYLVNDVQEGSSSFSPGTQRSVKTLPLDKQANPLIFNAFTSIRGQENSSSQKGTKNHREDNRQRFELPTTFLVKRHSDNKLRDQIEATGPIPTKKHYVASEVKKRGPHISAPPLKEKEEWSLVSKTLLDQCVPGPNCTITYRQQDTYLS